MLEPFCTGNPQFYKTQWQTEHSRALQPPNTTLGIEGDIGRLFVRTLPLALKIFPDSRAMFVVDDFSHVPQEESLDAVKQAQVEVINFSREGDVILKGSNQETIFILAKDNTANWIEVKDFLTTTKKLKRVIDLSTLYSSKIN